MIRDESEPLFYLVLISNGITLTHIRATCWLAKMLVIQFLEPIRHPDLTQGQTKCGHCLYITFSLTPYLVYCCDLTSVWTHAALEFIPTHHLQVITCVPKFTDHVNSDTHVITFDTWWKPAHKQIWFVILFIHDTLTDHVSFDTHDLWHMMETS